MELEPALHDALRDLDGFSHLWLVTHLHAVDGWRAEVVPFLDTVPRGVLHRDWRYRLPACDRRRAMWRWERRRGR